LSRFVECLWAVTGTAGHKRERVLPNGVVEVIINLGSFHKVLARDDYSREQLFKHRLGRRHPEASPRDRVTAR